MIFKTNSINEIVKKNETTNMYYGLEGLINT
jgi:hypothetical protein